LWVGLFFDGLDVRLSGCLWIGSLVALNENCCEGMIFNVSVMIGDKVYDVGG
jgi:hypothetical protein